MAKTNEITVGQNTQLSVQQTVQSMMDVRREQGMAGRLSIPQAIEIVCRLGLIESDINSTKEQKREAKSFACEIVLNSEAVENRNIQRTVETIRDNNNIIDDMDDMDDMMGG